MDGVMTFSRDAEEEADLIANKIAKSRYFPELRTIMVHDPKSLLDPKIMQQGTRLPVVNIALDSRIKAGGYRFYGKDRQQLWIKTTLESPSLEKILSLTKSRGRLPEPLRIAHLLAKLNIPRRLFVRSVGLPYFLPRWRRRSSWRAQSVAILAAGLTR